MTRTIARLAALAASVALSTTATADPCGMLPPIALAKSIERIGLQRTYVFFRNGVETIAIRPGFTGTADQFGMLVPFPSPPTLRKVPDDLFAQIAAAIDPPEIVVSRRPVFAGPGGGPTTPGAGRGPRGPADTVLVLNEEAIGQYHAVVLAAGSAGALKEWMTDHAFRFPDGMEGVAQEYVDDGWCFVAVKARVGAARAVAPRPGMRSADLALPEGVGFDGFVQGMAFRFEVEAPVVPMRLSAFNEGERRNIVYVLTDRPVRIAGLDVATVRRQVDGEELVRNLTRPLPVRVVGEFRAPGPGSPAPFFPSAKERDPYPKSGQARDQFVADLLAASTGRLLHPIEGEEKRLLEVGVALGLRPGDLDALHAETLRAARDAAAKEGLDELRKMTLTVIDGDVPLELLATTNLALERWRIPSTRNDPRAYDARRFGPRPRYAGRVIGGRSGR